LASSEKRLRDLQPLPAAIVHSQDAHQVAARYINPIFMMDHPQRLSLMKSVFGKKTAP
jgi:hypothetical protein